MKQSPDPIDSSQSNLSELTQFLLQQPLDLFTTDKIDQELLKEGDDVDSKMIESAISKLTKAIEELESNALYKPLVELLKSRVTYYIKLLETFNKISGQQPIEELPVTETK